MQGGGTLSLRQDGPRLHLDAVRPEDGRGLYKVWLTGQGGERVLLGTMAPEGGRLRLSRTLSVSRLQQQGCWPVEGAEAALAFPFAATQRWYCEHNPQSLIQDPLLREQMKGAMLCRKKGDGFCLAAPFSPDRPVALTALFCLAQVESLEGRPHFIWNFDAKGSPKLPYKMEGKGKDECMGIAPNKGGMFYAEPNQQGVDRPV